MIIRAFVREAAGCPAVLQPTIDAAINMHVHFSENKGRETVSSQGAKLTIDVTINMRVYCAEIKRV